jgi:hypothetical protein
MQNMCKGLLEESHANSDKVSLIQGEDTCHRSIRAGLQGLQKNGEMMNIDVYVNKIKFNNNKF